MELSRRSFLQAAAGATAWPSSLQGTRSPRPQWPAPDTFEFTEWSVSQFHRAMESGRWSGQNIVELYLTRIRQIDAQGPRLGSIIETNPQASTLAAALDSEREPGLPGPTLDGIPVLVKDNIDTADEMSTTAGSLALEGSIAGRDAFVVERLRLAGAIIIGKTNLSEWANFRSQRSTSGWSARGGQCRNPYALNRNPCGSSSGSAAAVSANLASMAVGTETDGSIVCPAAKCGIVGLKPTVGLISRTGVIPVAQSQDTCGPMARTVYDAALLLGVLAGTDPQDPATAEADTRRPLDYTEFLDREGLRGARIGVARNFRFDDAVWKLFDDALDRLRDAGASIIDPAEIPNADQLRRRELTILLYEFKDGINRYLGRLDTHVAARSLSELIAFNRANANREMPHFGQELFTAALAQGPLTDRAYRDALTANLQASREDGIDRVMNRFDLDALVSPTGGLPWMTNYETGDQSTGGSSQPAAVAGYPHITVPMGLVEGLPLGVSFMGRAWSEPTLLRLAYAYEQATRLRAVPGLEARSGTL